jgi:hypothetical protein
VDLIQLLLPLRGAGGDTIDRAAFAQTREELVDAFKGVTAYTRTPAQGVWISPRGEQEKDDVIMVEVLADKFDPAWWRDFGQKLAKRFDQEQIHIRALAAETP